MADERRRATNHLPAILALSYYFSEKSGLKVPEHWGLGTTPLLMTRKKLTLTDLLQLLLGTDVGGVAARLLAAVGGARVQARVALPEEEQKH